MTEILTQAHVDEIARQCGEMLNDGTINLIQSEMLEDLIVSHGTLLTKIESLQVMLNAKLLFINNGWEEERYVLQESEMSLRKDNEQLIAFARKVIQVSFDGGDLDGGEIQEMGVKHGLLVEETYDFEKHGEIEDFENGDLIYTFTDVLKVLPKAIETNE